MDAEKLTGYPSIDKPWRKYYTREALEAPLPECSMYEYLRASSKERLEDVAIVYFDRKITYKMLFQKIDRIASVLASMGVKQGSVVSIISLNTPEAICTFYALNKLGAIACMEYVTQSEEALVSSIRATGTQWVFVLDMFFSQYAAALQASGVAHIVVFSLSDSMGYIIKWAASLKKPKLPSGGRFLSFVSFLKLAVSEEFAVVKNGRIPAVMVSTSGTTGVPKKVVHSSFNINSIVFQYQTSGMKFQRGETYLSMAPLFLAFGITLAIHLPLCVGVTSVIALDPDAKKTIAMFVKYRPNHFLCGDYHLLEMISSAEVGNMDLSFLRTVALGGESLSPEDVTRVNDFLKAHHSPVGVITGYGMTEVGATAITEMNSAAKAGTVGIPQSRVTVKVVETKSGAEKSYGEVGELLIHAPGVMLEYWHNPQETDAAIETDPQGRKWVHSGDLAKIDCDGFVSIQGRMKRIYRRLMPRTGAIYKIFPDYIEQTLSRCAEIKHCAVVCIKHEEFITVPVVFVVPARQGTLPVQSLMDSLRAEIGDYNVPVRCIQKNELPLLPNGKVDYRALESEACNGEA